MFKLLAVSLVLPLAMPVAAQTTTTDTSTKPVKEKKFCRREIATGSMMAKSICHTQADWQSIDAAAGTDTSTFHNDMNRGAAGPTR